MDILSKIYQSEKLDEEIRDFLYPKLYTMLAEGRVNKGLYNKDRNTIKQSLTIRDFTCNDTFVTVNVDIWWGGDVYDTDYVKLTPLELSQIKNFES